MTSRLLAAAALSLAPLAAAPSSARAQAPLALDKAAAAVRPGSWTYSSKLVSPSGEQGFGVRTISVASTTYGGAPAWLLVDTQQNPMGSAADSLYVGRADLASVRRVTHIVAPMGEMVLWMDFTADSAKGELSAGGQKQPIAMENPRGAVVGDAAVLALLAALPLAEGWTATLPVLNPQLRGAARLTLAVHGAEKVTVPAGTFDAWVVQAESGPASATYYVAKGGPVVKVVAALPQLGSTTVETVLERSAGAP
jgi:hypothetical protein